MKPTKREMSCTLVSETRSDTTLGKALAQHNNYTLYVYACCELIAEIH